MFQSRMLFDSWTSLLRVLIVGSSAYAGLVLMLRISGKRTLSKMNVFDLVVTVALGSTLASVLLSKNIALAEGLTAFALLISLQFIVAWLSVRSETISHIIKATPRMLLYRGKYLHAAMHAERVTEAEVLAAIRAQGVLDVESVWAVVLETEGSFTVMQASDTAKESALRSVKGPAPAARGEESGA